MGNRLPCLLVLLLLAACSGSIPSLSDDFDQALRPGTDRAAAARGAVVFLTIFTASTGLGPNHNGDVNADGCVSCHDGPHVGGDGDREHLVTPEHTLHHAGKPDTPGNADRISPPLFGLGDLAEISDDSIRSGCGLAGRAMMDSDGSNAVRRFGRRPQALTVLEFAAHAAHDELGLDNHGNGKTKPGDGTSEGGPDELTVQQVQDVAAYVGALAAPPPGPSAGDAVARGLFVSMGCAACHDPTRHGTDLCLHDMGAGLAENDADVSPPLVTDRDWRTAPLMGTRFRRFLLHDGRVTTIEDAIEAHGGEAAPAAAAFANASSANRSAVVAFAGDL